MIEHIDQIAENYHLYLRIKFWQLSNHARRNDEQAAPLSESERANLEAILPLFGNEDPDRLLKADALRQLGEFERAEGVLADPFQQQVKDIVLRLKELVREKETRPAIIFSGAVPE